MIIYYSMIIWNLLISVFYALSEKIIKKENKIPIIYAVLSFGFIIFWAGIRTRFGDTFAYINSFNAIDSSFEGVFTAEFFESKAPLFYIFGRVVKVFISSDVTVYLMLIALIQGIPIMMTLRKYSENYFYSVFLFITSMSLFYMFNGIRQFIAVAILFGCTKFLVERKWLSYFIIVLILSLVHYTALIMIPIYFVAVSKPWRAKTIIFIAAIALCAVFSERFTVVLEAVLEDTAYAGATDQFAQDDGAHPLRVVVALVPIVLSFIFRKKIAMENNPFLDLMVNMSVITAGLFLVANQTSGILIGRLPIYTSMYSVILLPYIFNHYFPKKDRKIMYFLCTIGYIIFFILLTKGYFYRSDLTGHLT